MNDEVAADRLGIVHLPTIAVELLTAARAAPAGRAARTLQPGAGAALKQTVMALSGGSSLADHQNPGTATLQVLSGAVRLSAGHEETHLGAGDHVPIPPSRHGLAAVDDAVVLITVAPG